MDNADIWLMLFIRLIDAPGERAIQDAAEDADIAYAEYDNRWGCDEERDG